MGHEVSIGGNRLGSGNKLKAYLHNYERSTHDLSNVWRSSMACGTLVPFLNLVALPGDTFDIDMNVDVMTLPTIGPLFGSYKVQLDVFSIPVRLYQAKLHMNMLGIGRDMSSVALPIIEMRARKPSTEVTLDNLQINSSAIFKYLGISGIGQTPNGDTGEIGEPREYNGVPWLAYWDIYKNYYANKQEEIGAVIHRDVAPYDPDITEAQLYDYLSGISGGTVPGPTTLPLVDTDPEVDANAIFDETRIKIIGDNILNRFDPESLKITFKRNDVGGVWVFSGAQMFNNWEINPDVGEVTGTEPDMDWWHQAKHAVLGYVIFVSMEYIAIPENDTDLEPEIVTFPLANIDTMRRNILQLIGNAPFNITSQNLSPYSLALQENVTDTSNPIFAKTFSQEGLALKTYQSDLFNNWISTDWIDGPDGISEVTKIDTTGNSFTIDELNLSKKIYDMLNRIAISGGSYDDWLDAVYTHDRTRSAENPMYMGGLIQNVVFQEVVSNAATEGKPLGTLAGRGRMGNRKKGGKVIVKTDEPSFIMGIISITPNIDYSQGNDWSVNLKTMNDFHKPALDAIGFQDLITDQMAWWDTTVDVGEPVAFRSAGKQPAWINYMTAVNKVYGTFAEQTQQMFMVLNRRYTPKWTDIAQLEIKDLTTYIDPVKFNHIFADTRRDAQNFWVQVGLDIEARRKMSAKVMPNL